MAILANRVKTKNYLIDFTKFVCLVIKNIYSYILLIIACCLLYLSSTLITELMVELSGTATSANSKIYNISRQVASWVNSKTYYFRNLQNEKEQLKQELLLLKEAYQKLLIHEKENQALKKLLNVTNSTQHNYITAKVVGLTMSPFANSVIINAGKSHGVKVDGIVKTSDGLVGRIVNVSDKYATVILPNDHNSRIPAVTGSSQTRGIIAKQGDNLKLIYINENHSVQPGEIVYTSGDGKVYPYGLPVAVVDKVTDEGIFLKMKVNLNTLEFSIVESNLDY
jgi:rod shape-determining protein MreC